MAARTPARILVIEDDPASRSLMTYLLGAFGYQVTAAASGEEALDRVAGALPQLVLCDLQLPAMDGFAVAAALRARGVAAPLIAVTAWAMVGDRERVLGGGFDDYLPKPIEPEQLLELVARRLPASATG